MNRDQILEVSSMPAASPSYLMPPFRFVNREYMIVMYESDPSGTKGDRRPAFPVIGWTEVH